MLPIRRFITRYAIVDVIICCSLILSADLHAVELRAAAQDSAPKYYLDEGEMRGLCVDIMKAMEAIDPHLRFSGFDRFYPIARIEEDLTVGERDVFFGMIRTPKRESKLTFIDIPLYQTNTRLAVRRGDPVTVRSLSDLRTLGKDGIVLVVHGTAHADFLAGQEGLIIDPGASTTAQNMKKLLAGRGRFIYQTDLALAHELRQKKLTDKISVLPISIKSEPQYLAVSKSVPEPVVNQLRMALETLHKTGELARLRSHYLRLDATAGELK